MKLFLLALAAALSSCAFTTDGKNHTFTVDGESVARAVVIYSTK